MSAMEIYPNASNAKEPANQLTVCPVVSAEEGVANEIAMI
jgi:hypothetical protein